LVLLGDGAVTQRETKTRPLARFLRREERVEDPTLNLLRDARPVVLDFDNHPAPLAAGPDNDLAGAVHRVDCVDEEIGPYLIQHAAVGLYSGHVRAVVATNGDAILELVAQHHEGVVETLVRIYGLHRGLSQIRVSFDPADDLREARRAVPYLTQQRIHGK